MARLTHEDLEEIARLVQDEEDSQVEWTGRHFTPAQRSRIEAEYRREYLTMKG